MKIANKYNQNAKVVLFHGDCLDFLKQIPDSKAKLVVTSPPYNIGQEYEEKRPLDDYIDWQSKVILECTRILHEEGSICWQVGSYTKRGEYYPLDILLYDQFKKLRLILQNRIIWYFRSSRPFGLPLSNKYETILWFSKKKQCLYNLDPIRIPRIYAPKIYWRPAKKKLSGGNPLGKNPGNVWLIPHVQNNHPERTVHPCQFPIALIERLVLALTNPGDLVVDPFIGSGTTAIASLLHNRRCAGSDKVKKYVDIAKERIQIMSNGNLKYKSLAEITNLKQRETA